MEKKIIFCFLLAIIMLSSGCFRHIHTIGSGPHTDESFEYHQWYAFWGLLKIGDAKDGGQLFWQATTPVDNTPQPIISQSAETNTPIKPTVPPPQCTNCRITTEFQALDCLINFFTFPVTIYRSSITIDK